MGENTNKRKSFFLVTATFLFKCNLLCCHKQNQTNLFIQAKKRDEQKGRQAGEQRRAGRVLGTMQSAESFRVYSAINY